MSSTEFALRQQQHALYVDHHGWLHAWLRKKLRCPHRAEDVRQNTFLRVLSARDAIYGVEQPRAWLTAIAKRLIVDEVRRQRIEQAYLAELTQLVAAREHEGFHTPEQTMQAVQALVQLSAVLAAAPPRARTAFVRHYLDGETQTVVAAELGVSTKMVQKYLARVLLQARALGLQA